MQTAHQLGIILFSYANDNGGKYPTGKSSTEVFQKLLDGGYVTDPTIFYFPMAGKIKPVAGQKLKPENVCWDVTEGVDATSSDEVPLVFLTGYKVNYAPGGEAVPLAQPYLLHQREKHDRTFYDWLIGRPLTDFTYSDGIPVYYKGNRSIFEIVKTKPSGEESIPNFISPDFKPDGKTYRQLTPDGELPP